MSKSKRLVFFGSGPVGAATLEGINSRFDIEAIVTKPKPEHHRGSMPVLDFAQQHNIKTFTPTSKQELANVFEKAQLKSQVGLVVDYGIIIPQPVIEYFKFGIVNSHFSLLPQWRGADPITFSLLSGQAKTGVSLMLINQKLDEGLLLTQEELPIKNDDVLGLTQRLVKLSNQMLLAKMPQYLDGQLKPYPQPSQKPSYSKKLVKDDGIMDWSKPAERLEREVRAYAGWPRSIIRIYGNKIIVTKARVAKNKQDGALVMQANPGYLEVLELVAPSGKTMSGADFIRGYSN